mgnify:CR=1 FL=1
MQKTSPLNRMMRYNIVFKKGGQTMFVKQKQYYTIFLFLPL